MKQLNVNTLLGAVSLAVLLFLGHTIMQDHDTTTAHTDQLNHMESDVDTIKSALPNYELKSDADASEKAIWQRIQNINSNIKP